MGTRRVGESREDYLARCRLVEKLRRADPVKGDRIRQQRRASYVNSGGAAKQSVYLARLRGTHFFVWRARHWSARWSARVTAAQLAHLWVNQRGRCALSGRKLGRDAHLDHIVPVSLDGAHTIDNLRWLDPLVNVARGQLDDKEFLALCQDITERHLPQ